MRAFWGFLLSVVCCCAGCTSGGYEQTLPELHLLSDQLVSENSKNLETSGAKNCEAVFPGHGWQLVHSIRFSRSDQRTAVVIGAISLSADKVQCALMTIEGLTLFAADLFDDGQVAVHHALAPFDRPEFASGLMHDIHTMFRKPSRLIQVGETSAEGEVCRYSAPSGEVTDVYPRVNTTLDTCWLIKQYSAQQELERRISGCLSNPSPPSAFFPNHVQLEAFGMTGYSLDMKLLSAVPVP